MINFFIYLIISVMTGFGMAILLVEKGKDFPIKKYRIRLQLLLRKIHYKAPQMLYCTTCTSFWTTLIVDIILLILSGGAYFFWPFSGFITVGFTWAIIEFLNGIDKDSNINVFIDNKNDEN